MEMRKTARAGLENKRKIFLEIGFIVALLMVFFAFEYRSYESVELPEHHRPPNDWVEEHTKITVHKKPIPAVPVVQPRLNLVDDLDEVDDMPEIDASADDGTEIPTDVIFNLDDEEPEAEDNTIYLPVQAQPEYPGGLTAMMEFLRDHIKYSELAKEMGISGTVYVGFILEKDGSVNHISVERGIGGGCDEEAVRVVGLMPQWKPGMQTGKKVRVAYILPVKFTLRNY